MIHNESLSSARLLRTRLGDFLHTNQLYVLHTQPAHSTFQPISPRTAITTTTTTTENIIRRISSERDTRVDENGRRMSGYAARSNSDANQMLLNGHEESDEGFKISRTS